MRHETFDRLKAALLYSRDDPPKPHANAKIAARPPSEDSLTTRSYSVQEQLLRQQARVQMVQGLVSLFLIVAVVAVLVRMAQAQYSYDIGQKTPQNVFPKGRSR